MVWLNLRNVDSWVSLDGRTGATGGTAQFPSLLSGYLIRPPWQVAGVDYAVGLKSNVSVDITANTFTITGTQNNHINGQKASVRTVNGGTLPGGIALDTAYFVVGASGGTFQLSATSGGAAIDLTGSPSGVVVLKIPVAGTNCMPPGVNYVSGQGPSPSFFNVVPNGASDTTNGNQSTSGTIAIVAYDFSFDNGISVAFDGCSGIVNITNSYWRVGSNFQPAIWSSSFPAVTCNLSYCEFNGGGLTGLANVAYNTLGHLLYLIPGGVYQYCWIHHTAHPVVASPYATYTWQFGLMNNNNYGQPPSHNDGFFPPSLADISNTVQQFSTWYQPTAVTGVGGNGYPGEMDTSYGIFLQAGAASLATANTTTSSVTITCGNGDVSSEAFAGCLVYNGTTGLSLGTLLSHTTTNITLTGNSAHTVTTGDTILIALPSAITNVTIKNSVVVGLGATGHMGSVSPTGQPAMNEVFYISPRLGSVYSGVNILSNYVDSTGIESFGCIILDNDGAGTVTGKTYTGNLSLTTGATIVPNVAGTQ